MLWDFVLRTFTYRSHGASQKVPQQNTQSTSPTSTNNSAFNCFLKCEKLCSDLSADGRAFQRPGTKTENCSPPTLVFLNLGTESREADDE